MLALTFEGAAGGENFLRQIGGRIGQRRRHGGLCRYCGNWRGLCLTAPDQDTAGLIYRQTLAVDQLVLEGLQVCLVQLELDLESTISQPATPPEHGGRLVQHLFKGHDGFSPHSSSSVLASWMSAVSNPVANQP